MTDTVQKPGLYVRVDGDEYPLTRRGRSWMLWAEHPVPGFVKAPFAKNAGVRYERTISPDEQVDCFRLSHTGIYRKISVAIYQSNQGRVMAVTKDPRARENGFDSFERDEWVKLIPLDDPELRITTARTPVPAPWLQSEPGGR